MNSSPQDFDPADYIPGSRTTRRATDFVPHGSHPAYDHQPGNPADGLHGRSIVSPETWPAKPRLPHLGYVLVVLLILILCMLVASVAVLSVGRLLHLLPPLEQVKATVHPRMNIAVEALSYAMTFAIVIPLFRRVWNRPFGEVLHVRVSMARRYAVALMGAGVALSILAQFAETYMTLPKEMPMDAFFQTSADVWAVALFGTFFAPIAEEMFFRGFLLPAVAIAFDWIWNRKGDATQVWTRTEGSSRAALIFSGILTSVLFAVMHAAQLGNAWNAVGVLTIVGCVLTAVRLRFHSVAASSLLHMAYNGFIFAMIFVGTDGFRHLDKLQNR